MIERIRALAREVEDLQKSFQSPEVHADPRKMRDIGKRLKELEPLVRLLKEYDRYEEILQLASGGDPELQALAQEEAESARSRMVALEQEMQKYLVKTDPHDDRSVILEVRAGAGGDEAALFAAELLRMYIRFAEKRGWKTELLNSTESESGGMKEASLHITGAAYGDLKYESGVHRVQRIPVTENKGRVHTSTATVAILPEAEAVDIAVRMEDLRIDTYRASGAGGQHVNKTESAVRLTHIPTGVVVACQTERSQLRNRELAMQLLRSKLFAAEEERRMKERGELRSGQIGSGDRSEKIRTYNFPQDRVTDHRINENFSNLPGIMEGNLDPIIESLSKAGFEEKLQQALK